jgi:hypothetical protein
MNAKGQRKFKIFIWSIIVIAFAFWVKKGFFWKGKESNNKIVEQMASMDNDPLSREEKDNILKSRNSDIDGWSVYDKLHKGLNPSDGSDSDGDGLTDKEEVEVYGSDPLKVSTAGDLYSDSYKVANGMEVKKNTLLKGRFNFHIGNVKSFRLNLKQQMI